jgi:hypothetical protein
MSDSVFGTVTPLEPGFTSGRIVEWLIGLSSVMPNAWDTAQPMRSATSMASSGPSGAAAQVMPRSDDRS